MFYSFDPCPQLSSTVSSHDRYVTREFNAQKYQCKCTQTKSKKKNDIRRNISFHFEVINERQALFFAKYFFFEVLILWWKVPHSFYLFVCYDPSLSQILLMLLTCFNGEPFTWFKLFAWLPTFLPFFQILWYTINPFDEGEFTSRYYSLEHINNVYHRILHLR